MGSGSEDEEHDEEHGEEHDEEHDEEHEGSEEEHHEDHESGEEEHHEEGEEEDHQDEEDEEDEEARPVMTKVKSLRTVVVREDQRMTLQETFSRFADSHGKLGAKAATDLLSGLGANVDQKLVAEVLLEEAQVFGTTEGEDLPELSAGDFTRSVVSYFDDHDAKDELVEIWRLAGGGAGGEGQITTAGLAETLRQLGESMTDREVKDLVAFGSGGLDSLDYNAFVALITNATANPEASKKPEDDKSDAHVADDNKAKAESEEKNEDSDKKDAIKETTDVGKEKKRASIAEANGKPPVAPSNVGAKSKAAAKS